MKAINTPCNMLEDERHAHVAYDTSNDVAVTHVMPMYYRVVQERHELCRRHGSQQRNAQGQCYIAHGETVATAIESK